MGDNVIISMKPKIKGLIPKNYVAIPTAWVQYGPPLPTDWDKPSGEDIMHFFGFFKIAPGLTLGKNRGGKIKQIAWAKENKSEYCLPTWDKEDSLENGIGGEDQYNKDHWANEHGGAVKKVHEALLKDPYALNTCTKQWFGKGVANCVKSCLSRLGEDKLRQYIGMPDLKKASFGDMSRSGIPWAGYHYHFDGKGWLVADERQSPHDKPKFIPVDKWKSDMNEDYMNDNAQSLDYLDERDQEARAISETQTPLLNKFARQQRLNPKFAHPALRGMMDAVAQVYVGKDEDAK